MKKEITMYWLDLDVSTLDLLEDTIILGQKGLTILTEDLPANRIYFADEEVPLTILRDADYYFRRTGETEYYWYHEHKDDVTRRIITLGGQ